MSEQMWMWLAITSTLAAITSTAAFCILWRIANLLTRDIVKDRCKTEEVAVIMTEDPDGR
jgi:hypothetical protein